MSSLENDEIKARIHHYLVTKTNFLEVKDSMHEDQLRLFVDGAINKLCQESKVTISAEEKFAIIRELVASVVSLGPLRPFVEDATVTEIMVNGAKSIYIQRAGKIEKTNVTFPSNENLMHTIQKILAAAASSR